VKCAEHGVVVAAVPWARPSSDFTRDFEETCVWLVKHLAKDRVAELMRIAWRTVGTVVTRVVAELTAGVDRLAGPHRIGIDEISHRKGHRYLTVVVDHDTGRIVWAGEGRCKETLEKFFDLLGEARSKKINVVSADAAEWISTVVEARCPQAKRCMDSFHVVAWATDAVDAVRRRTVNDLNAAGRHTAAKLLKGTRWALLKNPMNQTGNQRTTVASIGKTNRKLYTAYLLKEQLREVFKVGGDKGKKLLAGWLAWVARCRIPEFVKVGETVRKQLAAIHNTLDYAVTNARVEATNTHLRQLTRRAYGFHTPDALIAMALLTRGGLELNLPGRLP
jgi:transposase